MGNSVPSTLSGKSAPPAPDLHVYLTEFPSLVYSSMLKPGKLLKTAVCKSGEQGDCVFKVYRKPAPGTLIGVDLEPQLFMIQQRLTLIRDHLTLNEVSAVPESALQTLCDNVPLRF